MDPDHININTASQLSNATLELFEAQIMFLETLTARERARILRGHSIQALNETDSDGSQMRFNVVLIALASTFRRIERYANITLEFPQSTFTPDGTDEDHIDEGNRQGEQSGIHGANRDRTSIESEQDIVHVAPFNRSASPQDDRDDYHDGEYSEHGNQYTDIVREYYEPLRESRETSLEPATPSAYPVSLPSTPAGDQGDDEQFSKTETDELDETPHLPSDAKPWFQRAFDSVSSIDLGPRFRELLTLYIQVESIQEYEESKKRFQKDGRPVELSTWILSGRWRIKRRPQIKDLDTFKKSWWNWWINMQPRWREINTTRNRPVQGMYGRSWHRLIAPGRNGWLSVVACLYWWGCTICDDNGKAKMEFEEAVKDTIFMMEGFLSYMKGLRMSPEV